MLSKEEQLLEECKKGKIRSYTYMIPILDKFAPTIDRAVSQPIYVLNVESVDTSCRAEARGNRNNLRSN